MIRVLVVSAALVLLCSSGTMWAQEPLKRVKVNLKARPFNIEQVRLLGGPFKQAMQRPRSNAEAPAQ